MTLLLRKKSPTISSSFDICPIPLRYDTYMGCTFNCAYCFAEPIINHIRTLNNKIDFDIIEASDPEYFDKWLTSTIASNKKYTAANRIAIQNKMPIKIGVLSDPFPYIEEHEKITYAILKSLDKFDYPIQLSTKNPALLSKEYADFKNPNWVLAVSLCSINSKDISKIEPGAPSLQSRIEGIKSLTKQGASVFLRLQPFIYPYALSFYKEYVDMAKDIGCKGIIVESLKMNTGLSQKYKDKIRSLNEIVGYDIIDWYKANAQIKSMDYVLKLEDKLSYINLIRTYADQVGIKILVGENEKECKCQSCHNECCGTYLLKQHTIAPNINQSADASNITYELDNCKINMRNKHFKGKTIKEIRNLKS